MSTLGIPKTQFIDARTGDIAIAWRQFLIGLWSRSGGSYQDEAGDILPPSVAAAVVPPVSDDITPPWPCAAKAQDDVAADHTESLRAQIKALRDEVEALKQGITA